MNSAPKQTLKLTLFQRNKAVAAALLLFMLSLSFIPPLAYPARAQFGEIPEFGGGAFVPTGEVPVLPVGAATISEQLKIVKFDVIATNILKLVIKLVRDIVIRWIITGRYEGPVFAKSFTLEAKKSLENAARIYLSRISGIDFCAGFGVPGIRSFSYGLDLGLECSLPRGYNHSLAYLDREYISDLDRYVASLPENDYGQTLVRAAQAKTETEARALIERTADLTTGGGFFGIRDPNTGKVKTPGSFVAELVMENQIVSPIRQTDVADDIQTAIGAIINTAIQVLIERGLDQASGSR